MNRVCISSLVVRAWPASLAGVRDSLSNIPEAEVLGESADGKLVVMLDTASSREAADRITDIQKQAGVLSASLIYQYDNPFESQVEEQL